MGPFHPETAPPPLRLLRSVGPERNGQDDLVKLRVIRTTPDFQHRVLLVPRIPRKRKVARRTERNRATVPIAISHSVLYDPTRGLFYYTSYIQNAWSFGGSYVDTTPYPASGCSSWETPGDCLTDAQIQAEVQKVMALKGWTGGLNKMFFVYTSSAEGSCAGFGCAYSDYCAYHSYFYSGSTPVIYGNEPYADTRCQLSGTPSPNGDPAADAARVRHQSRTDRGHHRSTAERMVLGGWRGNRRPVRGTTAPTPGPVRGTTAPTLGWGHGESVLVRIHRAFHHRASARRLLRTATGVRQPRGWLRSSWALTGGSIAVSPSFRPQPWSNCQAGVEPS